MLFDNVVGHSAACSSLARAIENSSFNHAYLFTGPTAVGKFIVARTFAASLLCPRGGCGECDVCRRVMEEKHPDVTVIRPDGLVIPVDAIREMRLDAFKKPSEGSHRVYIIKSADRMKEEAYSTLLKVLEEPPRNVVFVLVSSNPDAVAPTIRSRCQEIRFSNVAGGDLREYLIERRGVSAERADLIARLTGGVLGRALDWVDEPWRFARRDHVIGAARALRRADLNQALTLAQDLYRDVGAPAEEVVAAYRDRKKELLDGTLDDATADRLARALDRECKRERSKEEARGLKEVFSTLSWWYRDILISGEGADESLLVNRDLADEIAQEAAALAPSGLLKCMEILEESMKGPERNVPAQLNVESALLRIQEVLYA